MGAYGEEYVGTMQEYGESGTQASADAKYYRQESKESQLRGGVQVFGAGMDAARANEGQSRDQQGQALALMQNAAMGNAPSQAQIVGRQQTQQALASQRAMAASVRGPQALAMAQQNAAMGTAAAQSAIGGQTMANNAAEMQANRGAYFAGASGMRAGDLGAQQQMAGEYTTQAQMNDAQRARNDAREQAMLGNEITVQSQQQNAHNAGVQAEQQYAVAKQNADTASSAQDVDTFKAMASAGGGFMSAAMSDERTKESVKDAKPGEVEALLSAFKGAKYKYKDEYADKPGAARGEQFGPGSAQAIAKTKLGKSMVKPGDDGILRIDSNGALKALMGAVAHVNAKVEARRGR